MTNPPTPKRRITCPLSVTMLTLLPLVYYRYSTGRCDIHH
jgi:hypothetical protein